MKDITPQQAKTLCRVNLSEALPRVRVALDFLWKDSERSIHDKVAGDRERGYDYEELLATLLCAEAALVEAAEARRIEADES
jgi:hypothetical protein